MSKESAKEFALAALEDDELRERTAKIEPEKVVAVAKELGYDFTAEELAGVINEDMELSADDLEGAAGGRFWAAEERSDGKEYNCNVCNLKYDDQKEKGDWCKRQSYCETNNIKYDPHPAGGGGGGYVK